MQLEHHEAISHAGLQHGKSINYALCGVESWENIAACIRAFDAIGGSHLYFDPVTYGVFKAKISKIISMSRSKNINVNDFDDLYTGRTKNSQIICLEITKSSQSVFDFAKSSASQNITFIVGNEKIGISNEILTIFPTHLHVPMCGKNSSMNVATSLAIASYVVAFS